MRVGRIGPTGAMAWERPPRDRVREVPFFLRLTAPQLRELEAVSTRRDYAQGEVVFRQGEPGDAVFLVLRGAVRLLERDSLGRERETARVAANGSFGEVSFLLGTPRTASAVAADTATLMRISRLDFNLLLNAGSAAAHRLVYSMCLVLAARLHETDSGMLEVLEPSGPAAGVGALREGAV